ncbi:MAG: dihydrolipoyl dehydrogenase, partial [Dehalococcoidia bacterium]
INASGGEVVTRLAAIPHLLHTQPQIGWIGLTEAQARAEGYDVRTGSFDLAYNARSITLGARQGLVKLVTERSMGQIIGVHVVGPEASELLAVVATAMQAEMTVDDLAVAVHWHPSMAEALVAAARRAR